MPYATQVLIVGERRGGTDSRLSAILRQRGFTSADTDIAGGRDVLDGKIRPDIIIIDFAEQAAEASLDRFIAFARAIKAGETTRSLPIIAVDLAGDETRRQGLHSPDIDDVLRGPLNELQVCARVNTLVRLTTMHEELVRRLSTSARYGVDAPVIAGPPMSVEDATVLVVGATESFPVIERALSSRAALVGALTTATALDYLSRRNFDAVILDVDADAAPALDLCRAIRRNSRLFNIPVILLSPLACLDDPGAVFAEGVSDVIAKPLDQCELEGRVAALIREMRFRDTLRAIYREARHMATSDGLTGLYSRGFLLEHLENVIADARKRKRELALAYLSISNLDRLNAEHGYIFADRVIRQVGEMMGFLVRGEDLTARYSGGTFCIILPDTSPDAAKVAIRRITSVVKSTELSPDESGSSVAADLIASVIGDDGLSSAEALVDKAKARLG